MCFRAVCWSLCVVCCVLIVDVACRLSLLCGMYCCRLLYVVGGSSLLCVSCCLLFAGCRLLVDAVLLLCGVVCCRLCVVGCVLLPVVKGFAGVCCALSDCRCVRLVWLCRLLLDLGVRGVMLLFVV